MDEEEAMHNQVEEEVTTLRGGEHVEEVLENMSSESTDSNFFSEIYRSHRYAPREAIKMRAELELFYSSGFKVRISRLKLACSLYLIGISETLLWRGFYGAAWRCSKGIPRLISVVVCSQHQAPQPCLWAKIHLFRDLYRILILRKQ